MLFESKEKYYKRQTLDSDILLTVRDSTEDLIRAQQHLQSLATLYRHFLFARAHWTLSSAHAQSRMLLCSI